MKKIVIYIPVALVTSAITSFLILKYFTNLDQRYLDIILIIGIIAGTYKLVIETLKAIRNFDFGLDYIAILAISVALITNEFFIAIIVVLMLSGGETLEDYAQLKARKSMQSLVNRLPDTVLVKSTNTFLNKSISEINKEEIVVVRKGEVIPLDGVLQSESAFVDESSITGEAFSIQKFRGDMLLSGTANVSDAIEIKVTKEDKDSTFRKIIQLVKEAEAEKNPMLKMADKYSLYFTLLSLFIAAFAYFISGFDIQRVLAVLVIATPCPLIIAAPVAFIGGVNSLASKRIIAKNLLSLEAMAKVNAIIFDKTGTLTLGEPQIEKIIIVNKNYTEDEVIQLAASIERVSLHPFAKVLMKEAQAKRIDLLETINIQEKLGVGVSGEISNEEFSITKSPHNSDSIELLHNKSLIASIIFSDVIKPKSKTVLQKFINLGTKLTILSGDHQEKVDTLMKRLDISGIELKGDCKPIDKKEYIEKLKAQKYFVAMVGDGINDAPALAYSDVGIAFANQEQTITSEVSDILILGGGVEQVLDIALISKRTVKIAKQSIFVGIGLSIVGMGFASVGMIVPVVGALIQEGIDVAVILNGLRASRSKGGVNEI